VLRPLHVYVHFPWCLEKCPYCDFVSYKAARASIDHDGYADALLRELEARRPAFEGHALATIFFGGGTPSLWEPRAMGRVIAAIRAAFPVDATVTGGAAVEVTSECNPTSLDEARAHGLVEAGVNRLSVGVQSFDDEKLRFLGRLHDVALANVALAAAISTGARVSADLIFGLPGQPAAEAAAHAAHLADLGLSHVSAYALTIEHGTRFGELARRGKLPLAEDDAICDAFLAIERALGERGLEHYEVSNYARPGQASRHNLGYWRGAPYLGLGSAAYGFLRTADGGLRYRNQLDPGRYMTGTTTLAAGVPREGDGVTLNAEPLDRETLLRERIMLGLRLDEGVDLDAAARDLGLSHEQTWTRARRRAVDLLVGSGGLTADGDRLRIPSARRLSTDGIAARLF
jgi:oxygen-independent coproporphyrinogen-3 oxidase